MSVLATCDAAVVPFGLFLDEALSQDAATLREKIKEAYAGGRSLVDTRPDTVEKTLREAEVVAADDATTPTEGAYLRATALLCALPSDIPLPEVVIEPDGEIGLDWDEGRRRVLSVSVGESTMLSYAALIGSEPTHGRVAFAGQIPPTLTYLLRRLYSNDTRVRSQT